MNDAAFAKSDGTTLIEHIDDCLNVFNNLRKAIPLFGNVTGRDDIWELLFIAIYIHDFGKCHIEFQKVLKGQKNCWNSQRHELYSMPFIDKLNINDDDKKILKRIILAHHKDFNTLVKKIKTKDDMEFEYQSKWFSWRKFHPDDFQKNFRHGKISPTNINWLIRKFEKRLKKYNINSDINFNNQVDINSLEHPYVSVARKTVQEGETLNFNSPTIKEYWLNLLLWGLLKICDHYGSAKIAEIHTLNKNIHFNFLNNLRVKLKSTNTDFYSHQKRCFKAKGNCILIAPTGTGKTEAAIGWLKNSIANNQGRAFYILPYTASINAMHKRLSKDMDPTEQGLSKIIGIQHGKMMQYLLDIYESNSNLSVQIDELKEYYKRILPAIKVATPFQILKFCFGVKNYEMGFAGLIGAKLIFDEIHAYDIATFSQIMVMLKYFIKHLKCEVFIMTATLPSFMLEKIYNQLKVKNPIRADKKLLKNLKRHKIIIREGTIFDQLDEIISKIRQKTNKIIIVCNTVATAQKIFQRIISEDIIDKSQMTLLHSRFNGLDRAEKEKNAIDNNTILLVGTQAIEVSLDINYDIMFTEPAPIDALLQRFGRINRKCEKPPCKVIICHKGGKSDKYIYKEKYIFRTLEVLKKIDIIDENMTQSLLDKVYPDWDEKEKEQFKTITQMFEQSLASLKPFLPNQEVEDFFYEQFSNIPVLPIKFLEQYRYYFERLEFIKASQLFVNVSKQAYAQLSRNNHIEAEYFSVVRNNNKILSNAISVTKCKYTNEIGLIFDKKEKKAIYDNFL